MSYNCYKNQQTTAFIIGAIGNKNESKHSGVVMTPKSQEKKSDNKTLAGWKNMVLKIDHSFYRLTILNTLLTFMQSR